MARRISGPGTKSDRVKEFLNLMGVAWENQKYRRELRRQEQAQLGGRSWYRALDRALTKQYRWNGPFFVSKWAKRQLALPKEDLIYGETPILTAWHLLERLGVDQADHVVELGAGRSLFSLVAVSAFGSSATSVEIVPAFVRRTRQLANQLGLERLRAREGDILSIPLVEGSVYFVTATTFSAPSWLALNQRLAGAPSGSKAVSLSAPLTRAYWKVEAQESFPFSWGENTVYFQTRRATVEGKETTPDLLEAEPEPLSSSEAPSGP